MEGSLAEIVLSIQYVENGFDISFFRSAVFSHLMQDSNDISNYFL